LRKGTISLVMSVRPSAWKTGSNWMDFHEILKSIFFENLSRRFNFHWNLTRTTVTSHKYQFTFLIISRPTFLGQRNVSDKSCREHHNTLFCSILFFRKSRRLSDNVKKNSKTGQATDWHMADAHFKPSTKCYKHTLIICKNYCISTVTKVARTSLHVTLYVYACIFTEIPTNNSINRKVAGSIPDGVIGIFRWYKILPIALWPWGRRNL